MKVGDNIPVTIAGQQVANAVVKEMEAGTVTLEFPATRVVMATRTELAQPEPVESETETVITGVERNGQVDIVSEPAAVSNEPVQQTEATQVTERTSEASSVEAPTVANAPSVATPSVEASSVETNEAPVESPPAETKETNE